VDDSTHLTHVAVRPAEITPSRDVSAFGNDARASCGRSRGRGARDRAHGSAVVWSTRGLVDGANRRSNGRRARERVVVERRTL